MYAAGRLLTYLDELGDRLKEQSTEDMAFVTPYATISAGLIQGGVAGNVIPSLCKFSWEVRAIAHGQAEQISADFDDFCRTRVLPRLAATSTDCGIATTQLCGIASLEPEIGGVAEKLMMGMTGDGQTHSMPFLHRGRPVSGAWALDGGLWSR
ncbi:peptidase dimerization domain-containing protein [Rhizobium beringeri]